MRIIDFLFFLPFFMFFCLGGGFGNGLAEAGESVGEASEVLGVFVDSYSVSLFMTVL